MLIFYVLLRELLRYSLDVYWMCIETLGIECRFFPLLVALGRTRMSLMVTLSPASISLSSLLPLFCCLHVPPPPAYLVLFSRATTSHRNNLHVVALWVRMHGGGVCVGAPTWRRGM